jgi:hypothetical protein
MAINLVCRKLHDFKPAKRETEKKRCFRFLPNIKSSLFNKASQFSLQKRYLSYSEPYLKFCIRKKADRTPSLINSFINQVRQISFFYKNFALFGIPYCPLENKKTPFGHNKYAQLFMIKKGFLP